MSISIKLMKCIVCPSPSTMVLLHTNMWLATSLRFAVIGSKKQGFPSLPLIGSSIKESWACESLAEFCDTQCPTLLASSLWSIALLALFTHLIHRDDHVVHLALQGSRGLVLKDPIWIHIICSCRILKNFLSFVCSQGTHPFLLYSVSSFMT